MAEQNELYFLISTFTNPLGKIWKDCPDDYRPMIILDNSECKTPFEFLYVLLESKLESFGSLLRLDPEKDNALINKLDELRILCRFIDGMSNYTLYLYSKPDSLENPFDDQQDYYIWSTVRRVCTDILEEPKMSSYKSHDITIALLCEEYRLCYIDDCEHKA